MKRRSDIAKMVSAARQVWRYSLVVNEVKKEAKTKPGWFKCRKCHNDHEVIKIDHIVPIGKQPKTWFEFGKWLDKLFCPEYNLQPLCNACHKLKTKEERRNKNE